MRRFSFIVAFVALMFSPVLAQDISVSLDNVQGLVPGTDNQLIAGTGIVFGMRFTNNSDLTYTGFTNGFRIYSDDGATWSGFAADTTGGVATYQSSVFINPWSITGADADTIGCNGFTIPFPGQPPGFTPGMDAVFFNLSFATNIESHGKTICLDSTWTQPNNSWQWSEGGNPYYPAWDGPHCFTVIDTAAPQTALVVLPDSLTFNATEGDGLLTAQPVAVSEQGGGAIDYSAVAGDAWVVLTDPTGTTPGLVDVNVDATGVTEGTYTSTVTVTSTGATNTEEVVVTLNVAAAPKILVATPDTLFFTATEGDGLLASQDVAVSEQGGAAIGYSSGPADSWVELTNPDGTTPGTIGVAANATGVTEGTYYSSLTVSSEETDNDVTVVVSMTVAAAPGELVLDTDTLFFEGTVGDGILPTQQVQVTEAGGRNISYSAGPDMGWIGLTIEATATPGAITVMVSTESVAGPGVYTGTVTVSSPDAENDPQFVVVFTVNDQPSALVVDPTELNALGQEGVAETIRLGIAVSETHDRNIAFSAVASQSWLTFEVASGTTPDSVIVLIATGGLTEGVYNDNITIISPDADTIVVPVTLTMSAADSRYLMTSDTTFFFTVNEGDTLFPSDAFLVMEEEGDTIPFTVTPDVAWLTVDPTSGSTPEEVAFSLVGPFFPTDSPYVGYISIASDSAVNSPLLVQVNVSVNPCPRLILPVITDTVTVTVGEVSIPGAVTVLSDGDEISWSVPGGSNFTFDALNGMTPDSIIFTFNETFTELGQYERCFTVSSPATYEGGCSSEVDYCLLIIVEEAPCSDMILSDTLFAFDAVQGDVVTVPEYRLLVVTPGLATVDFTYVVEAEAGVDYVSFTNLATEDSGASVEGEPGDSIEIVVNPSDLPVGTNTINCTVTGSENVCAPGVEMFTILVDVEELIIPSDDTVRVVTQPAVPGMQMMLPVYFSNSCPTQTVFASLEFDGEALNLDSVSFAGTRAEGLEGNEVTYFNATPLGQVNLTADVGAGDLIPTGSGAMANLYFSVRCETESGYYPLNLSSMFVPLSMTRDCGEGLTVETPEFVSGGIVVDTSANYVCGYVVDEEGNSIPGATVELYGDFPVGPAIDQTTSSMIGSFAFADFTTIPFDLYAYADGYYPNKVEDLNFGDKGVMIVLSPLPELTPTSQWVDYFCNTNTYAGEPLPVGSVVEAWFNGLLVGQDVVTEAGSYGFMPVYRASDDFGDDGAMTDSTIAFTINGMPAIADGDVIYPADYDQVQVCLSAGDQEIHSCDLLEGWNLISWRVDTESDDLMDVLGPYMNNIEVILGFEQGGLTYDPDLVDFSTLYEVDHLSGYWIKVKEGMGFTLEVTGAPVAINTPIPVTAGWNLVSYLPQAPYSPVDALLSLDGILLYAYGWDAGIKTYAPAQPDFSTLEEMAPCNGYWVKVSANGTLVYPEDILIPGVASTRPDAPVASAATSYKSTQWVNLYSRDLRVDGHAVAEGDIITAHTAAGNMVGEFKMSASGKFGFMPVYGAASASEAGVARGEDFYLAVNGTRTNETFTWTGNGDRIEVLSLTTGNGVGNLPEEYSLAQNYPNPFNPTTTISFNLPVSGTVKLEVFNILGELVATPYDGRAEAGTVEVVWDGSNTNGSQVSSGVYFYRLTADTYTNTRKMMLLK